MGEMGGKKGWMINTNRQDCRRLVELLMGGGKRETKPQKPNTPARDTEKTTKVRANGMKGFP